MDYTQQVTEALNGLGATSAEIAQTLENKGIRAKCGRPYECAIAHPTVPLPPAISDFIGQFDVGAYPNLVL